MKRLTFVGVRGALLWVALAPAGLISAGLIAYFAIVRIQDMEQQLIERGRAAAANLASASEFGVYAGNQELLDRLARSTLQSAGLAEIHIMDRNGSVLARRQAAPPARSGGRDLIWFEAPVQHTRLAVGEFEPGNGIPAPDATPSSDTLGSVRVAVSRSVTLERQRDVLVTGTLMLLVCLTAVSFIGLLVGGRIYRPIRRLSAAFDQMSVDNLEVRVPEKGPWEMKNLERGFNAAADALARSRHLLQDQVREATEELRETLLVLERKNNELEQAHRDALRANEAKSRFVSSVSHEFRKPLHSVIAGADLLLNTDSLDKEQRKYTAVIHHSAHLLRNMVNNILDWARIEATDDLALSEQDFSPAVLLEQTLGIVEPEAQSKGVRVDLSVETAVPDRVRGDPTRLGQVLLNLVGNAVKFTGRGQVTVAVRAVSEETGSMVRLRFDVTDTGIGIEPRAVGAIFEGFAQADATIGRDYGGTGLGLSITRRLVKRMNGEIGVESAPGAGSRFWVEIPFPSMGDSAGEVPLEAALVSAAPVRSLHVLAADDDWGNRQIIEAILAKDGHTAHLVSDGEAALAALQGEDRFDLAVLDLQMPKLWGDEVVKRYRADMTGPPIPVILLTADVTVAGQEAARVRGVSAALQKPIIEDELIDVIHRLITGRETRVRGPARRPLARAGGGDPQTLRPVLLDRLQRLPQSVVPQVIDQFVRDAGGRVARVREAAAAGDALALREALHLLGGASVTLGGEQVAEACESIRRALARGDAAGARAGVAELPGLMDRLIERLKAYPPR